MNINNKMNELMKFSEIIMDEITNDELFFLRGGSGHEQIKQVNNGSGTCTGTNNSDGRCSGTNNGDGKCG